MDVLGKLAKYGIITVFGAILFWFASRMSAIFGIFPDYRMITLIVSICVFILVIACKRGIWH